LNKLYQFLKRKLRYSNFVSKNTNIPNNVSIVGSYIAENVTVGPHSKVTYSTLRKNTIVGAHNVLKKSELSGRFSSLEECKINESHLYGNISIGRYTSLWGPGISIKTSRESVEIGNFCSIARHVYMQTFNHNTNRLTSYYIGRNVFGEKWENERTSKGDIVIGNDVWIGAHAIILGGVTIGNGAVIAANTVVTKDVPSFAIVAGVPGKVLDFRFEPEIRAKIEALAWWNWSIEKIKANKQIFKDNIYSITSLNDVNG